ncbi:glutathione S-transferase U17-like [Apium graveolens]|uniref:glutathione S-transferase U17-like n=1 Tax=Apium graveolens TaxID=4045 RepID=UPI003D79794E
MVSTTNVKLLGAFFSPFVNRVQMAFNLKSVEFEYVEESLSSKSKLLLDSNPVYGKVPVMIHDDKIICESLVIVQYIDQYGYRNRPIFAYVDDKLIPLLKELLWAKEEEYITLKERVEEVMTVLEKAFVKCSAGKAYFGGDDVGFIDIALGSCLEFIRAMEEISAMKLVDEARTPELVRWAERLRLNDAVKDFLPETEMVVDVLKRIQSKTFFTPVSV